MPMTPPEVNESERTHAKPTSQNETRASAVTPKFDTGVTLVKCGMIVYIGRETFVLQPWQTKAHLFRERGGAGGEGRRTWRDEWFLTPYKTNSLSALNGYFFSYMYTRTTDKKANYILKCWYSLQVLFYWGGGAGKKEKPTFCTPFTRTAERFALNKITRVKRLLQKMFVETPCLYTRSKHSPFMYMCSKYIYFENSILWNQH